MSVHAEHTIEISAYWQCDCGMAGSCPAYQVDVAAQKHVPEDEPVVYRHPGRRWW